MILLLVVAPFLGLAASGGPGSYVDEINGAARKLFEHAQSAGLAGVIAAVSLLGAVWTVAIVRVAACAVLVIFRQWQHLLAFAASVLVVGWVVHQTAPAGTLGTPAPTGVGVVAGALGPSAAVAGLAVTVVGIAYALVTAGIAHRDIKPSNLLARDGKVFLIDVAFCQVRPSPWRQVVDLANMMLVLALRTSPELVYQEALGLFRAEEIAEAFAATRGITMSAQLRAEIRKDGRDLVGAFRALAPARAPIRIQRWSARRLGVTVGVLLGAAIAGSLLWANLSTIGLR